MIDKLAYCGYDKTQIKKTIKSYQKSILNNMAKPKTHMLSMGLKIETSINFIECKEFNIPHKHYYKVALFEYEIEPDNMIYDLLSNIDGIIAILNYLV